MRSRPARTSSGVQLGGALEVRKTCSSLSHCASIIIRNMVVLGTAAGKRRRWWEAWTTQRLRTVLWFTSAALLAVLAAFTVEIAGSQARARHDAEQRFLDRARVSAQLTESLLSSAF